MEEFTFSSICTSGGVFEQGVVANGINLLWGVEINPRVAEVYKLNYPNSQMIVGDACEIDFTILPRPDFLHASPSCRHFSGLNNKKEAAKDIAVAEAVSRAIAHFKPDIFTLENVTQYKDSQSWKIIKRQLEDLGYKVSTQIVKMRFWGVPHKRRNRFIVIATLNHPEIKLIATNRTNRWYELIEDLIPNLKPSELTNTQIKHLTAKTKAAIANKETVLLKRNQIWSRTGCAFASEPYCWTPTATLGTDHKNKNRGLFADLVTPDGIFSLDPRCLARIQTIPDSYILPDRVAEAVLVVGDSIPPLFATQMWEQILDQISQRACPHVFRFHKGLARMSSDLQQRSRVRQLTLDLVADKLFPQKRSAEQIEEGKVTPPRKISKNGYLQTRQKKRKKKSYKEYYYRFYQKGKQQSIYVEEALFSEVQEAITSGESIGKILLFLGGASSIPTPQSSIIPPSKNIVPPRKRKKGIGTGYIEVRSLKKGNKAYKEYWFHYEIWSNGKCQKKSKYIPKRKEGAIAKMNADKAPVAEILKAIGANISY